MRSSVSNEPEWRSPFLACFLTLFPGKEVGEALSLSGLPPEQGFGTRSGFIVLI